MLPLSALDAETCQKILGVVFDIDDTLTRDGKLEREAFHALWDLRQAGLHAIGVTGRPLGWADVFARIWPVDLVVGENGAGWIASDGRSTQTGYFLGEEDRVSADALLKHIAADIRKTFPHVPLSGDHVARRVDLAFDIGETHRLPKETVDALCKRIRDLGARTSVSSVHAHAFVGAYDKAQGVVRAARDILGKDIDANRSRWLFVGDSGNDAPAFAYFPVSVGVSNIVDHLANLVDDVSGASNLPTYVTTEDRGRGFAELVAHILRGRIS